jgi:hypothetical protein
MTPHTKALFGLLLAIMATASHAEPPPRLPVTNVKVLLRLAIEHGSAYGTLVGEAAAFVRNRFGTTTPIEIDIKTLQILRDPGCRRLEVTTYQAGVIEKGIPADKRLTYQLNYCRDGRMPERS